MIGKNTSCRLCLSNEIEKIFSFGKTPFANSFLRKDQLGQKEKSVPLKVFECKECLSVQLRDTVDPKILFSNYLYSSSESGSLKKYFAQYVEAIKNTIDISRDQYVVDIGSNDGILIQEFLNSKIECVGVEPASNLAAKANKKNLKTYNGFFNKDLVSDIIKDHQKKAKIICCNNCFAHIDDLHSILESVCSLMDSKGLFIFENAYLLDTINGGYFDQVYHEHIYYHSLTPIKKLLLKYGLEIIKVEKTSNQGGTIRFYTKFIDSNVKLKINKKQENLNIEAIAQEEVSFYSNPNRYSALNKTIKLKKKVLQKTIAEAQKNNKTISAYGCPAKFTTFTKVFGLDGDCINYVVDDSPTKQGLYAPGNHIPIVSKEYFTQNPTDYCVITAWNFSELIINNNKQYKGNWINPFSA